MFFEVISCFIFIFGLMFFLSGVHSVDGANILIGIILMIAGILLFPSQQSAAMRENQCLRQQIAEIESSKEIMRENEQLKLKIKKMLQEEIMTNSVNIGLEKN